MLESDDVCIRVTMASLVISFFHFKEVHRFHSPNHRLDLSNTPRITSPSPRRPTPSRTGRTSCRGEQRRHPGDAAETDSLRWGAEGEPNPGRADQPDDESERTPEETTRSLWGPEQGPPLVYFGRWSECTRTVKGCEGRAVEGVVSAEHVGQPLPVRDVHVGRVTS